MFAIPHTAAKTIAPNESLLSTCVMSQNAGVTFRGIVVVVVVVVAFGKVVVVVVVVVVGTPNPQPIVQLSLSCGSTLSLAERSLE